MRKAITILCLLILQNQLLAQLNASLCMMDSVGKRVTQLQQTISFKDYRKIKFKSCRAVSSILGKSYSDSYKIDSIHSYFVYYGYCPQKVFDFQLLYDTLNLSFGYVSSCQILKKSKSSDCISLKYLPAYPISGRIVRDNSTGWSLLARVSRGGVINFSHIESCDGDVSPVIDQVNLLGNDLENIYLFDRDFNFRLVMSYKRDSIELIGFDNVIRKLILPRPPNSDINMLNLIAYYKNTIKNGKYLKHFVFPCHWYWYTGIVFY